MTAVVAAAVIAEAQSTPPNVLLITIDTLRADRVGPLTPTLDALARRGARFTRAYAHAPTTLASHASILTGLVPPSHGVRNNGTFRLDEEATTVAEVLKRAGYRTGAFVGAFVLDARYGLGQGFDEYDDRVTGATSSFRFSERRAPDVLAPAAAWIGRQPSPWFAWIHLFDPHAPYAAGARGYDGEVAFVDTALGGFFNALGPALAQTLVIVTADHGESLGEHGERTHGLFAYDATLRVPLILAGPGIPPGVVHGAEVSHADVAPTLLDLAGADGVAADGRSLRGALRGETIRPRPIYFEALDASLTRGWAPLTGVVAAGWKFVDLPLPELYDLNADPAERVNRADDDRIRAARLRDIVIRIRTASEKASGTAALADAEARARLRALGYVGGAFVRAGAWLVEDDPKRLVDLHARFQQAVDTAARDPAAAISELTSLIDARPDFAAAYESAATLLIESGRAREAVTLLTTAHERGLRHRALTERLGTALVAAGNPRGAIAVLEPIASLEGNAIDVRHALGMALVSAGEHAKAREHFEAVVRLDPTAPAAWTNLGALALQRGARSEARAAFEHAIASDESTVAAWKGLGAAWEEENATRAAEAYERALGLAPRDYDTLAALGFLLARTSPEKARPHLERLVKEAPNERYAAEKRRARELLK